MVCRERRPLQRILAIPILVVGLASAGCSSDDHSVLMVLNATDRPVDVVIVMDHLTAPVDPAHEIVVERGLQPGLEVPYDRMKMCLDAVLVARQRDGTEVARSASPICRGTTWAIVVPAAASPS